jgi:taurine dioxygenase
LRVVPCHPLIGSEVLGVSLDGPFDDEQFEQLHDIWMNNPLLIFKGVHCSDADQIEFARRFGGLEIHPSVAHRLKDHPEIYRVSNVDQDGALMPGDSNDWQYMLLTWLWHTDSSFREVPSKGSILRALEVPSEGGDTLFANMYAAYEALTEGVKAQIESLRVEHSHDAILNRSEVLSKRTTKASFTELPGVVHPLVRRHPVTGKRSLFLSPHTMEGVVGMAREESDALLAELTEHATEPRFVYRHSWQAGDVLMWDNRCTMHAVMPFDNQNHRRILHRTTLIGDEAPIPVSV